MTLMKAQKAAQDKLDLTVKLFQFIQGNDVQDARELLAKANREDMLQDICMADIYTKAKWLAEIPGSVPNYATYQFIQSDPRVPLLEAIERQRAGIVEAMLFTGLNVNAVDTEERGWSATPLQAAVTSKNTRIGENLLNYGADPLQKNCFLQTPLFEAIKLSQLNFVNMLLKKTDGKDVNWTDTFNKTPLVYLLCKKHEEDDIAILKLLKQFKPDVNKQHNKLTPPMMCVQYYSGSYTVKTLQILLQCGSSINGTGPGGKTPLHLACMPTSDKYAAKKMSPRKRYHLVCLLLKFKASPKARDDHHNTPLHYAAMHDLGNIANILLQYRASCSTKNLDGRRPVDLVARRSSVREILEQAMDDNLSLLDSMPATPRSIRSRHNSSAFSFSGPNDTCHQLATKVGELQLTVTSFEGKLRNFVSKHTEKPKFSFRNAFSRKSFEGALSLASTGSIIDEEDIYGPGTPTHELPHQENGTGEIIREFDKLKKAVDAIVPFTRPESNEEEQKLYKACRIVSETVGPDWKNLFRELVSHTTSAAYTEACIVDLENRHNRLSEQALQSLLLWKNWMGKDASCDSLVKGLKENRLNGAIMNLEDRLLGKPEEDSDHSYSKPGVGL